MRETAKGGPALSSWPAGGTVTVGTLTDAGYTLTFGGSCKPANPPRWTITNANGTTGTVTQTNGGPARIPPAGRDRDGRRVRRLRRVDTTGFQVTFGGLLAGIHQPPGLHPHRRTGFVGETDRGGAVQNQGYLQTPTGNHAPVVTTPAG